MKKVKKQLDFLFRDSLFKNSIYLMMTNFFSSILGFIFWIIAARYYSPNDIGITSAIFSSMTLISILSSLGLSRALTFYLPRDIKNSDKILGSCLTTNLLSSILVSVIFILGLKIWSPDLLLTLNNLKNILVFIAITMGMAVYSFMSAAFTAGRMSSFCMTKEIVYCIVRILPLIIFAGIGTMGILFSIGIGILISTIIGFVLLFKVWKYLPKLTLELIIIKRMAMFSAGNYIADIFYNIPKLVLPIMILNLISAKSAGYFYIAIMMTGLLYAISQSISSSLLVESSDKERFFHNVDKAIKFNLIILTPGLILFVIFGNFILSIFNPSYAENGTNTMIILTMASFPISLINIFNTIRNSQNRVSSAIKMNIIVAIITMGLSILLIRLNIEGVAISYLIANIIGAIIVINRIKNPKEFTLRLLNDIKEDIALKI